MRLKIIGLGAAGNKVAIGLIEAGVSDENDVVLLNSTIKDIPANYRDLAIRLSDSYQGCGQERKLAKDITLEAIKTGRLNLDQLVDPEYDKVVIITSTCGGTGSGASVIVAKYFKEVIGLDVEIIGMVGFEDESSRSLRNLIEFCQDLTEGYTVQLIRNGAFLSAARGDRTAAEIAANEEVIKRIRVMNGSLLQDSDQNIDDTDIKKLNNTTGYKTVEFKIINEKIKNSSQFDDILREMMDESPIIDTDASGIGRLGVIMNLQPTSQAVVDRSYKALRERLGEPYEVYTHLEFVEAFPQFIAIIASGMKMPEKEIESVFNKYSEMSKKVNTERDSFFDTVREFKGSDETFMFDTFSDFQRKRNHQENRNNFFAEFEHPVVKSEKVNSNNKGSKNDSKFGF